MQTISLVSLVFLIVQGIFLAGHSKLNSKANQNKQKKQNYPLNSINKKNFFFFNKWQTYLLRSRVCLIAASRALNFLSFWSFFCTWAWRDLSTSFPCSLPWKAVAASSSPSSYNLCILEQDELVRLEGFTEIDSEIQRGEIFDSADDEGFR